jgi:signal transduction histidine kinase
MPTRKVLVRHDTALVGQAVANLVANALKFTARGGSVLVSVQLLSTGAATITVRDTGVGILSDELPRIFDRFYRGSNGNRKAGSGLGLSVVQLLVEAMGASIRVESTAGEGSCFYLHWPLEPAPPNRQTSQFKRPQLEPPAAHSPSVAG